MDELKRLVHEAKKIEDFGKMLPKLGEITLRADSLRDNAVKVKNAMDDIMRLQVKVAETSGEERQRVFQSMLDLLNSFPNLRM